MACSEDIKGLAALVKKSKKTIALTGAGASTESGIPDFRSRNSGLWNKYNPEEVAGIRALLNNPQEFYRLNMQWWEVILQAKPNSVHLALAELEQMGWLLGVITQNIDGLHQAAGSTRVWEVHGHLRTCHCMECKNSYDIKQLIEDYHCPACAGVLRPDVVLFGDPMPDDYFLAEKNMSGCDLLLVVGSSLQVYPVAGLPYLANKVVIINKEATPWDDKAELVFRRPAGEILTALVEQLQGTYGPYKISD